MRIEQIQLRDQPLYTHKSGHCLLSNMVKSYNRKHRQQAQNWPTT